MAVNTAIGKSILFPITGNLSVVRQTGAFFETKTKSCWCREVFGIIDSFIEMHLLIANHRIGTFTSECCATREGLREGRDLSVVVKERRRYGL